MSARNWAAALALVLGGCSAASAPPPAAGSAPVELGRFDSIDAATKAARARLAAGYTGVATVGDISLRLDHLGRNLDGPVMPTHPPVHGRGDGTRLPVLTDRDVATPPDAAGPPR